MKINKNSLITTLFLSTVLISPIDNLYGYPIISFCSILFVFYFISVSKGALLVFFTLLLMLTSFIYVRDRYFDLYCVKSILSLSTFSALLVTTHNFEFKQASKSILSLLSIIVLVTILSIFMNVTEFINGFKTLTFVNLFDKSWISYEAQNILYWGGFLWPNGHDIWRGISMFLLIFVAFEVTRRFRLKGFLRTLSILLAFNIYSKSMLVYYSVYIFRKYKIIARSMITLLVFGNIYAFYWVANNLPYLLRGREKIILGMDYEKLILGNNMTPVMKNLEETVGFGSIHSIFIEQIFFLGIFGTTVYFVFLALILLNYRPNISLVSVGILMLVGFGVANFNLGDIGFISMCAVLAQLKFKNSSRKLRLFKKKDNKVKQ
jgi:hypothetical protein